jgi:hypothetical protein
VLFTQPRCRPKPRSPTSGDRFCAFVSGSTIGIALLIFGLIETELRKQLQNEELLPGLLPENRARVSG